MQYDIIKFINNNNHRGIDLKFHQHKWLELYSRKENIEFKITRQLGASVIFGYIIAYESHNRNIYVIRDYKDINFDDIIRRYGKEENIKYIDLDSVFFAQMI